MSHTETEKPKREQRDKRGPKGERRERRDGDRPEGERRPLPAALADRPSMDDMKAEQAVFRAQSKAAFDKIEILKASREVLNTEISTGDKGHSSTAGAHKLLRAERGEISKALDAVFQEQHAIQSELKRVDEQRRGLLGQLPFKDEETAQKMIKQLDNERMHGSLTFDEENQNIAEKKTIIKSLPLLETLTSLKGRRTELQEKKDTLSKQISETKAKRAEVDQRLDAAGFDPDAHQATRNAAFKQRDLLNEQITTLYNEVRGCKEKQDAVFAAYVVAVEEWKGRKESVFQRMRDMKDLKSEIWELVNKKRDIQKRANNLEGPDMAAAEAAEVVVGVLRGIVKANSPETETVVSKVAARDAVDASFVSVGRSDDMTMMGSGTKGKKGKRGQRREAKRLENPKASSGLDACLDLSFMQQCSLVGVSPPASIEAVPELLAQVEAMKAEAKDKASAKFEAVSGKCTTELAAVQAKLDALEARLSLLQAEDREEVAQIKVRAQAKIDAAEVEVAAE